MKRFRRWLFNGIIWVVGHARKLCKISCEIHRHARLRLSLLCRNPPILTSDAKRIGFLA
jgi:hypothetical protein